MEESNNKIEMLELKISEFQKQISLKREFLKSETEKENDEIVMQLQGEITSLKEKILLYQAELRRTFLKLGNEMLEAKKKDVIKTGI